MHFWNFPGERDDKTEGRNRWEFNINIVVTDLRESRDFFKLFGFTIVHEKTIQGDWLDRVTGLKGVIANYLSLSHEDSPVNLELLQYENPEGSSDPRGKRGLTPFPCDPIPNLDEPTNHLDIASREVLLEALGNFSGTIMIVSHDRYFLKHLVNRVFEIDHGRMLVYEEDYDYYLNKSGLSS